MKLGDLVFNFSVDNNICGSDNNPVIMKQALFVTFSRGNSGEQTGAHSDGSVSKSLLGVYYRSVCV
jgi:hypothetical protein